MCERVYSVKDLVIPIPNFVTDYNSGMAGALRNAYETVNGLAVHTSGGTGFSGEQRATWLRLPRWIPMLPCSDSSTT